ncbi:MAG: PepSY domain-containing protein [Candidatus Heimdallarchaeota archaeon]|nr:PepSY domain-containing protein [Candidatus Heimdallarchaeota archaeon]
MQKRLLLSSIFVLMFSVAGITVLAQNGMLPFNVLPDEEGDFGGNHQYPDIKGSIPVDEDYSGDFSSLATITQQEAEQAALAYTTGGSVVSSELENENGYLVWKVVVSFGDVNYDVLVDAGNGSVLACEVSD